MKLPKFESEESLLGLVFHQEVPVPEFSGEDQINIWVSNILKQESRTLGGLFVVFVNDKALLKINQTHLQHDTLTDIITFPYHSDPIEAEIYISIERVRANAKIFGVSVQQELLRVIAHGVLHLCGWKDKTEAETRIIRKRENTCLAMIGYYDTISSLSSS